MSKYVPPGKATRPAPSMSTPIARHVPVYTGTGSPVRLLCIPVSR